MLKTERITLRAWQKNDVAFFADIRNDIDLQEMLMTQARPNSEERVVEWLRSRSDNADEIFFVVADGASNQAIGFVQIVKLNLLHGTAELGICLGRGQRCKGVGGEVLGLLEEYLLRSFGLRKLYLNVLSDNTAAISSYGKRGFVEVGRLIKHHFVNGKYKDVCIMEKFISK